MNPLMPALNPSGLENDGAARDSSSKKSMVDENKPSFKETMDRQPRSGTNKTDDRVAEKANEADRPNKAAQPDHAENTDHKSSENPQNVARQGSASEGEKAAAGEISPSTDSGASTQASSDTSLMEDNHLVGDESLLESSLSFGLAFDTESSENLIDTEALNHSALANKTDASLFESGFALDPVLVTGGLPEKPLSPMLETLAPLQAFKALREQVGTLAQAAAITSDAGVLVSEGKSIGMAGMTVSTMMSNDASTSSGKMFGLTTAENDAGTLTGLALKDSLQSKSPLGQQMNEGSNAALKPFLTAGTDNTLTKQGAPLVSTLLNGGNLESTLSSDMLARLGEQLDAGAKPVSGAPPLHSSISPSVLSGIPAASDVRVQMPVSIAFGESGWGNMIAERSALMASQSIKFAELQLDPPELGQLQVKVTVNQDQASVSFVAANAQVKDALDQSLARLKELLEEQGLDLVNVDVSDQSSEEPESEQEEQGLLAGDAASDEDDTLSEPRQVMSAYGVDHYA